MLNAKKRTIPGYNAQIKKKEKKRKKTELISEGVCIHESIAYTQYKSGQ